MGSINDVKYNFQQKQFLTQLDPKFLTKAAAAIGKAKTEIQRRKNEELRLQQQEWARQAVLLKEGSTINMKKAEAEYKRLVEGLGKSGEPKWSQFEGYTKGHNPRFFAPNFFTHGYSHSAGGVNTYDAWQFNFGSGLVPIPRTDPTHGLMGAQISTANPGGWANFNTGLANLFFSQSEQTIPVSATFNVYGWGLSFGFGIGYSRGWVRLGVEAWVYGPAHGTEPVPYYFVNDFWSSVPSPWVFESRHFNETFSPGTHSISVLPGDVVLGSAVIEQGVACGGWLTAAKSEFLAMVGQLQIGP
jgi:hypothetical protein